MEDEYSEYSSGKMFYIQLFYNSMLFSIKVAKFLSPAFIFFINVMIYAKDTIYIIFDGVRELCRALIIYLKIKNEISNNINNNNSNNNDNNNNNNQTQALNNTCNQKSCKYIRKIRQDLHNIFLHYH